MASYTVPMVVNWLKGSITHFHPGAPLFSFDRGIRLLERSGGPLQPQCLYIGEPEAVRNAVLDGRVPQEGCLILASGIGRPASEVCTLPDELTLIETDLPLLSLYNFIQEHDLRFRQWDEGLRQVVYTNAGLQKMLEQAQLLLHGTILLLNNSFQHIASVYDRSVRDPAADELRELGYHTLETIHSIRRQTPIRTGTQGEYSEYVCKESNNYTIVHLIRYQDNLVARLCVVLDGPEGNPCFSDLAAILADYVREYMFSHQGVDYGGNSDFGVLCADLIERRLTDPLDLEKRLKQIKLAIQRYYHVMLVSFREENDGSNTLPWNYIINQLEYIFPFSNITTYAGDILLLIRKTKRGRSLSFNRDAFFEILEKYDGYAAVSNTSEFIISMPPVYYQAKAALRLGSAMDPEKRLFYYEDYSAYQIVELAAESARQELGSRNMVHLCNNELVSLVLYDKKNGTNLTDVLYTYLRYERNTTEAAKALYIHRNTLLYKIHKITEIIGDLLDDPLFRERYLFSYHVLEYMQKYRKEDLLVLKTALEERKATAALFEEEGNEG